MLEKYADKRTSIASTPDFFTNATGLVVCGDQSQCLFVADDIPGENTGKIYRIPLADIPFTVPVDTLAQERQRAGYTFLYNLDKPMALAVAAGNGALLIADDSGFRYLRFGFSGTALGVDDLPMIGAVVTVNTEVGTFSTTSDAEGKYHFTGINLAGRPQALTVTISHPDHSYTERIFYAGECHSNLDPVPCINIIEPADGAELNVDTTTVRGQVLPKAVAFQTGMLIVNSVSYPVTIDVNNEFSVSGVALSNGKNTITMMVGRRRIFQ